jgi:hypothetical protein
MTPNKKSWSAGRVAHSSLIDPSLLGCAKGLDVEELFFFDGDAARQSVIRISYCID